MSDFQIAILIFCVFVALGIISIFSETLRTFFTLLYYGLQMLWSLFIIILWAGFLILIITFMVHIYRMDL